MKKPQRLTAEELRSSPNHISREQLGWSIIPEHHLFSSAMSLPSGTNAFDLLMKHSPPFLLRNFRREPGLVRYAAHRGLIKAPEKPDNTMGAYRAALAFGARIIECDVMKCKPEMPGGSEPGFVFCHDRSAGRITAYSSARWEDLTVSEVEDLPIIVRQIKKGAFTEKYWVTDEKVTSVWEGSRRLLNQYPGLTIIYDTKDDQSPHFVAALSKRPELCSASLVQFYTWGPEDGEQFASQIKAAGAAADWKENVNLVPVVQIQPLAERLFADLRRAPSDPTRDYDDLFARVRTWVDSMMDEGFKVRGIQVLLGGIGESYDRSSGGAFDLAGRPVTDPQILEDYRDDRLLIDLHAYVRAAYPNLPIFSIVRAYDVAQDSRRYKWGPVDGKPEAWGKHSDLFEQHATPGKTRNRYDFDFIVADLFPRALEYEAHLANGIALDEKSGNPWADLTRSVADIPRQT